MVTQIEQDATKILFAIVDNLNNKGDRNITNFYSGQDLIKLTNLNSQRINVAVDILSECGYIEVHKSLGTTPFNFAVIEPMSRGIFEVQKLRSQNDNLEIEDHKNNWFNNIKKDIIIIYNIFETNPTKLITIIFLIFLFFIQGAIIYYLLGHIDVTTTFVVLSILISLLFLLLSYTLLFFSNKLFLWLSEYIKKGYAKSNLTFSYSANFLEKYTIGILSIILSFGPLVIYLSQYGLLNLITKFNVEYYYNYLCIIIMIYILIICFAVIIYVINKLIIFYKLKNKKSDPYVQ